MKTKDIFSNECRNPLIWGLIAVVVIAGFFPLEVKQIVYTLFFFVFGSICLYNFHRCGRIHCQITGHGFLAVGILSLLKILNLIGISWNFLFGLFLLAIVIGYGYEFLQKRKTGGCYCGK
ncbi:hypothetical protein HYS31_03040 [Candidatus Woesearchaeota archaeon]|nr:hypothetical protein [Candidatus Woesearchaeota archaeon]